MGMKNHFDISGSIEICKVDIGGGSSKQVVGQCKYIYMKAVLG